MAKKKDAKKKRLTKEEKSEQEMLVGVGEIEKELSLRGGKISERELGLEKIEESPIVKDVVKKTFKKSKPSVLVARERTRMLGGGAVKKVVKASGGGGNKPRIEEIEKYYKVIQKMKKEISKAIIGQEEIVDSLVRALLCDGHVLLEGVPGIAKTLAIRTLSVVSGCKSKRIQFTVDLLPTDITGISSYTPGKGFETIKGPIFANFLIADEINRSPPKTQSALIEAMQEKQVTIGKETFQLPKPFFVMATENPLEQSGVYTLPEAQVDRFLFKVIMRYPKYDEEEKVIEDNMTLKKFEDFKIKPVTNPKEIIKMQELTKRIYLSPGIRKYILDIVTKTRMKDFEHGELIEWGGSPRAGIALFIAAKARALMEGRNYVVPLDVKKVAHEILRHRVILSYRARAEKIDSDKIIDKILGGEVGLG